MAEEWARSRVAVEGALRAKDFPAVLRGMTERASMDLRGLTPQEKAGLLADRAAEVTPSRSILTDRFLTAEQDGRRLVAKFTVEAFADQFHLGNLVPLLLLRRVRRMGHDVVFVVGDVTARIGDPSGSVPAGVSITDDEIDRNLAAYRAQLAPFLDGTVTRWRRNSEWLNMITLPRLVAAARHLPAAALGLASDATADQVLYPLAKALDSLETRADLELGGVYQARNTDLVRRIAAAEGWDPPIAVSTPLIPGLDGTQLMSATHGNHVPLSASAQEIFALLEDLPAKVIETYLRALTEWLDDEIQLAWQILSEQQLRLLLAADISAAVHGIEDAMAACSQMTTWEGIAE